MVLLMVFTLMISKPGQWLSFYAHPSSFSKQENNLSLLVMVPYVIVHIISCDVLTELTVFDKIDIVYQVTCIIIIVADYSPEEGIILLVSGWGTAELRLE